MSALGSCAARQLSSQGVPIPTGLLASLASDPERALPFARCVVEENPLGEAGWITLIALLTAAGRGDEAQAQRGVAIRTLEVAGIRVPAALTHPTGSSPPPPQPASPRPVDGRPVIRQRVEFCTASDGTGLAYSCVGSGPPLVKTANWLNHLEFEWESPIWSHWIEELSRKHTLVRYDERGNGLSD